MRWSFNSMGGMTRWVSECWRATTLQCIRRCLRELVGGRWEVIQRGECGGLWG